MACLRSGAEEGGETAFPHSRWLDKEKQTAGVRLSDCAKDGVAALPRKGNASESAVASVSLHGSTWAGRAVRGEPGGASAWCAVMFWDTKPGSVRQDKWSMHAGEARQLIL